MNAMCQGCHIAFIVTEVLLHVAKEALQSWEGENHGPDISNQLVPLSDNEKLLAGWDSCQDFHETTFTVWEEGHCYTDCVHYLYQQHLTGGPNPVSLVKFF